MQKLSLLYESKALSDPYGEGGWAFSHYPTQIRRHVCVYIVPLSIQRQCPPPETMSAMLLTYAQDIQVIAVKRLPNDFKPHTLLGMNAGNQLLMPHIAVWGEVCKVDGVLHHEPA